MELLTGKCKKAFERFLIKMCRSEDADYFSVPEIILTEMFYRSSFSMKYGVLVDFFDSVGIEIYVERKYRGIYPYGITLHYDDATHYCLGVPNKFETRQESRTEAIKKANELFNSKN